jgi:hypothetical protein
MLRQFLYAPIQVAYYNLCTDIKIEGAVFVSYFNEVQQQMDQHFCNIDLVPREGADIARKPTA